MSKKSNRSKSKKAAPIKGETRRAFLLHASDLARKALNTASLVDHVEASRRNQFVVDLEWRVARIVHGAASEFSKKSARAWLRHEQDLINDIRVDMGLGHYRLEFKLPKSK